MVSCAIACLTVAAAAGSGGSLERRVGGSALIRRHSELAHVLVVWVLAMSVAALLLAYVSWYRDGSPLARWLRLPDGFALRLAPGALAGLLRSRWLLTGSAVLCAVTAVGTLVAIVLVGHSGAEAAWSHVGTVGPGR